MFYYMYVLFPSEWVGCAKKTHVCMYCMCKHLGDLVSCSCNEMKIEPPQHNSD